MNWKKFRKQYTWLLGQLEAEGQDDAAGIILRIVVSILQGYTEAGIIMGRSLPRIKLLDLVRDQVNSEGTAINFSFIDIINAWVAMLPRDAAILGEIYEQGAANRRTRGIYYTPPEVVEFIIAHTIEQHDLIKEPKVKVVDPACGCGYFLLKTYESLRRRFIAARDELRQIYPQEDWSDGGIHRHILRYNLWGADIDPVAADICAAGLVLQSNVSEGRIPPNIVVCDSLKMTVPWEPVFGAEQYDYVIGNPPYLSFGLRGAGRLDPHYEDYLRRTFHASAEYKLSYYVLFMQRGIDLLKPGGKLGFIVPDSFLLGRYYSKIRKYIMDHTAIEALAHISANVFKNASTGYSAICILRREEKAELRQTQRVRVYRADTKLGLSGQSFLCQYEQNYFATLPYQRFRLFFDSAAKVLIDKIDAAGTALGTFATGHTGLRSVLRQRDIIATSPQGPAWQRGLVSGSQICRYGIHYEGHWLNIDPDLLYKGGWRTETIKQRKILIRQTGDSLIAAIDAEGFYHLNNIHHFTLADPVMRLDYLVLLINSRLMSFYYHVVSMEYGRSMAQTDIETLERLPVFFHAELNQQAPSLVKTMMECVKREKAGDPVMNYKIKAFDEYLNQLVYHIYNLSDQEISYIECFETSLSGRRLRKSRVKTGKL